MQRFSVDTLTQVPVNMLVAAWACCSATDGDLLHVIGLRRRAWPDSNSNISEAMIDVYFCHCTAPDLSFASSDQLTPRSTHITVLCPNHGRPKRCVGECTEPHALNLPSRGLQVRPVHVLPRLDHVQVRRSAVVRRGVRVLCVCSRLMAGTRTTSFPCVSRLAAGRS